MQPGDKLMIAGFITQNGAVRAVVRAIGPSLVAFGINNALADTTLQLRDQNGAIVVENDDWKVRSDGTSQQAEVEATGLQPTNAGRHWAAAKVQPTRAGLHPPNAGLHTTNAVLLRAISSALGAVLKDRAVTLQLEASTKALQASTLAFQATSASLQASTFVLEASTVELEA